MSEKAYSYASSIKSAASDELINTYLVRPLAGIVVRLLFPTRISPNQVTGAAVIVGLIAGILYFDGTSVHNFAAGLCLFAKDILDSADGQLARAKQQYSRIGRFLDSIGDLVVNSVSFAAITIALYAVTGSLHTVVLGFCSFIGLTLRVSYHVFYHTSYLHLNDTYKTNRVTEEIRQEDREDGPRPLPLQNIFQALYGWQDRLMVVLDGWCRKGLKVNDLTTNRWYSDVTGLRISAFIGLGTELFVLVLFSLGNQLNDYLLFNCIVMNGVWLASVLYRRVILRNRLTNERPI